MSVREVPSILPLTVTELSIRLGQDRLYDQLAGSPGEPNSSLGTSVTDCIRSAGLWRLKVSSALVGLVRIIDNAIAQYDAAISVDDGVAAVCRVLATGLRSRTGGPAHLLRDYPDYTLTHALYAASTPLSAQRPSDIRAFLQAASDLCHNK